MKRNLLKGLAVAAFAMLAGYNVYQTETGKEKEMTLLLTDVEALAGSERGCVNATNSWGYCFVEGTQYKCENYWIWNCVTAIN